MLSLHLDAVVGLEFRSSSGPLELEMGLQRLLDQSPLVWSTDVRSTPLYGQFLAGPNHRTITLHVVSQIF